METKRLRERVVQPADVLYGVDDIPLRSGKLGTPSHARYSVNTRTASGLTRLRTEAPALIGFVAVIGRILKLW